MRPLCVLPAESRALQLAGAKTSIHVPKVYRSFQVEVREYFGTVGYFIMDYIEGFRKLWRLLEESHRGAKAGCCSTNSRHY